MKGFLNFIREQGVIGLAIGFILGGSISKFVSAFVNDLVNPSIGLLLGPVGDLKAYSWTIGRAKFMWGDFISASIDFLVLAAVVYYGFKLLGIEKFDKKKS